MLGSRCSWTVCRISASCIKAYRLAIDEDSSESDKLLASIEEVKQLAPKPLKPGFFRANQTDRRRYNKRATQLEESEHVVGIVLDVWEKRWLIVQCATKLKCGETLQVKHPKIKQCVLDVTQLMDMNHKSILEANTGQLVKIPWVKGVQQQSVLAR